MDLVLNAGDTAAGEQIFAGRALNVNVRNCDVRTDARAGADSVANERVVLLASDAGKVLDGDVGDSELRRELVAQRNVLLAVALSDFDGVIDIGNGHEVVGDVLDCAAATSTLEIAGESSWGARPDLDAGPVGGVGHADVVNVDVLDVVDLAGVLAETADADAMAAVAPEVLHNHVGAVGLEGNAVITVIDV